MTTPLITPDGRYIVVRGRPWRASNPHLPEAERQRLVDALIPARRAVRAASGDADRMRSARAAVNAARHGLGERGALRAPNGDAGL